MCKRIIKSSILFFSYIIIYLVLIFSHASNIVIASAADNKTIPAISYETDKSYDFSNADAKENMSYGQKSLGTLSVSGNTNDITTYKDSNGKEYPAYGLNAGQLKISYDYDGSFLNENGKCYLADDSRKKYNNKKLEAEIGKGILIIQKSNTGVEWIDIGNPIVNFFADNPSGKQDFYTTNGGDVAKGMFYRIIISYKTQKNIDWKVDPSIYHVEVYEFFACTNSGQISLHDIKADVSSLESEEYSVDVLKKGEKLLDGATTINGFSIDTLGASYSVTVNGKNASNGDKFTDDGKYTVKAKTKLGKETETTVYVFTGGKDKGKATYFNDMLVTEKRIFREEYSVPVYANNSVLKIKAVKESVPPLTGTIKNNDTNESITLAKDNREAFVKALSPGTYSAEFYSGNTLSGSVYHYTFNFVVLDEDAKPYVNKHNLETREELCDFRSEHYEVAYETTRGGSIYVCFDSYDEAFKYAYQIEKRYLEYKDNAIYYWQDKGNNNQKVVYPSETNKDKLDLTAIINNNAKKNIEIAYFDPSVKFSYQTIDEEKELKQALEDKSLKDSARVFPNKEEKNKLLSNDIPIINGYKFMQIADYDVKSVKAICEADDKEYTLDFSKPIDEQLTVSSKYTITETNKYGDKITYDVIYMADNQTNVKLFINSLGTSKIIDVSNGNHEKIEADSINFDEITNHLDDKAIVKIESDVYGKLNSLTCPIQNITGLTLYKAGQYTVTFVDRVGNSYTLNIDISGNHSYNDAKKTNSKTYSSIYNELHLNHSIKED